MSYCTHCGTAARTEQAFCTNCGAVLPQAEPPAPDPPSGQETSPGTRSSLEAGDPQSPPDPPTATWIPQPATPAEPAPAGMRSWTAQPPPREPRRSRAATVITVVAVLLILGGGGAAAWKFLGHSTARPSAAKTNRLPDSGNRSPAAQSSTPGPAASSPAGTQGTGPDGVAIAQAASQQPGASQVAAFLDSYFEAINSLNYSLYVSLYEPSLRLTQGNFDQGYQTTHDSGAVLTGLSSTADGLAASISFTSHQNPADSATGTSCTTWDITLYLQTSGSSYLIGKPPPGYHAQDQACS